MKVLYRYREIVLIILIFIQILNVNGGKYSKSTNIFPPLYDFDDYDACFGSGASEFESTYCMIYAEIKPQNSSELWTQISQHTEEYKFHYRRDRLFFGVCMERCKNFPKILENFPNNDSKVLNEITQFFEVVHKRPLDLQMRTEYHELINNCLNSEFQHKYGLSLRTYVEYCERQEESIEIDNAEKVVYKILEIIVILNILSTLYDSFLKRKQPVEFQNANYYKEYPKQPVYNLLTAFSIRRNYYRLVEPCTSQLGIDLSYLDGIRSMCVLFIVVGHSFFIQYFHVKNPTIFEELGKSPKYLWLTNGTLLLEHFQVLSGMLLYIKFEDFFKITPLTSGKDCFKAFCRGMIMRFIRFLPSLALFICVNATFFTRLQDGPFWRHLTEPGRTLAREKWWKNFFILTKASEGGFPHTWYMNTDFQLFAFYFCVLIAMKKYPQYKRKIIAYLAIVAVLIRFIICYFHKLEPVFLVTPESFRFTIVVDEDVFHKLYIPFYTNLGGYLFGIVCGEIYLNYSNNEKFFKQISRIPKEIYEFALLFTKAFGIWICCLGTVVIFREPSIWTALYGSLNRNLYILITTGGSVLLCMFCKTLSIINYLTHPFCRILSRLSFQIYLWHFSILYLITGYKREPIFANHLQYFTVTLCVLILSFGLAFIITIFIEYPLHRVINYYYKRDNRTKPQPLKTK